MRAGIPIVTALDALCEQPGDEMFSRTLAEISSLVGQGFTLSKAMSLFPSTFPTLYFRMVEVGESTGTLDEALESLAQWKDRDEKTKQHMKSALSYPVLVLGVTFVLTVLLLTVFVPKVLGGMGSTEDLPAISKALLYSAKLFKEPGFWLFSVGSLMFAIPGLKRFLGTAQGARLLLQVPLLGRLILYGATTRYALTLSTLLSNGVGLRKGLLLSAEACGSLATRLDGERMLQGLDAGDHLAEMFEQRPNIYPNLFVQMVRVGEESSQLTEMLSKVSSILQEETEHLLETLMAALEPLVMAVVAVVVGTVLVGVFSSIYAQLDKL